MVQEEKLKQREKKKSKERCVKERKKNESGLLEREKDGIIKVSEGECIMRLTQKRADQTINQNASVVSWFRSFDSILLVFLLQPGSWLHIKWIDVQYIKIFYLLLDGEI